uniref:Reverse transcriptase Ty1/copia-type domain-containing protein n=1 Tax=Tanacetum cinerariifolium TaxID=118510 RepID=A0A699IGA5_TANCI|nr:hypothetical protein [Tanacetum cinerariifolium]
MHSMSKTVTKLHVMLKLHEQTLPLKEVAPALHVIRARRIQKNQKKKSYKAAKGNQGKGKAKIGYAPVQAPPFAPKPKNPPTRKKDNPAKDAICHQCGEVEKLQHDGLLDSTDIKSFEKCISCMSRKMARKPYSHQVERATDLLGLIHTDVCGPFKIISRQEAYYFVTFTDDFSRYGYVYLLKHKHEVFETFKVFQNKVENQLGKTIKSLCSGRRDMVCFMMSQTTLSKSFLDSALESVARILNMVPNNKFDKTPYEVWHGIPKGHDGIFFLLPTREQSFVPWNVEFFENDIIDQDASRSLEDLEIIQEKDTHPSIDISLNHEDDDQEIDEPQRDLGEPANYKAALLDPEYVKWLNAMNVEIQFMKDNEVWKLVDLPPNGKTIRHKWLLKKKTDMDGAVHTYKAHIRAIRILIAIAAFYDNEIWQIDVKLPSSIDISMKSQNYDEQCVYVKASGSYVTFIILYAHDTLIIGNNIQMLQDVKSYLVRCFAVKDLEEAAYILGIKIYQDRSKRLIGLYQSAYTEKIFKRFYMKNSKRRTIPMQEKLKFSKSQGASTPTEIQRLQNIPYALAVGSIMYVVRCTRPDDAFAQNIASGFQHNPGEVHWTVVKNIVKYLRNTNDMFLVYEGDTKRELRVSCYTDAGYLTDADNMKSQIGYVFVLNGGVVDRKSTKQSIFATSSTNAEYIAAFDASKEAVWIRKFIFGLGVVPTIEEPINMYCDNTEAIAIAKDHGVTKGARHFRTNIHYLRETIEMGDVRIEKVNTDDNLAYPFTKALAFPKHSELTEKIGMILASSLM